MSLDCEANGSAGGMLVWRSDIIRVIGCVLERSVERVRGIMKQLEEGGLCVVGMSFPLLQFSGIISDNRWSASVL